MYLQSILKEFNGVITPINNFLIWYFRDDLKRFICAQLDKRDRNLDNQQAVIEQTLDAKAKVAQ